jgi:ABC-2 type transport system permease protein
MTTVVSTELFKLRTTRAPWAVATCLVALAAALLAFIGALVGKPGQPALVPSVLGGLARAPGMVAGGAALLLGLLLSTAEYRHATVLTTRLGHPHVPSLVLAKAIAAALAGSALALAVELVMIGGGTAILAGRDVSVEPLRHGVPAAAASVVLVAALLAVAGVGIAELLRSPTLAVGVVFGWVFLVEGVVPVVLSEPHLGRWLPTGAARSVLSLGSTGDGALLVPWAGLSMLAAYAIGLLLVGLGRSARTDP